jgi:hypothetical protein
MFPEQVTCVIGEVTNLFSETSCFHIVILAWELLNVFDMQLTSISHLS